MANTKSAQKAARRSERRTVINKVRRTAVRSSVRDVEAAIKTGDKAAAVEALKAAEPALMRGSQRGVLHKKTASRRVSRLAHQIAKLGK